MTIVTYVHRPKRPPKTKPTVLTGPAVVKPGRTPPERIVKRRRQVPAAQVVDAEAEARVAAFFRRNLRPPGH